MNSTLRFSRLSFLRNGALFCTVLLSSSFATYPASLRSAPQAGEVRSPPVISVKSELVALPVSVTDVNGVFVAGLVSQNFQVYEDGRLQVITSFQQSDTPVTVGLIVDHSRSMGPKLSEVAAAVSAFAHSSNPLDEMFVVDFNDSVSVELMGGKPFSNDPQELSKAISSVHARGRTALYDAVAEGLLHLQLGHCQQKALIIVSDGGDNASQRTLAEVLALARRSEVLIYSIGLIGDGEEENPAALRRLSKATGGTAYFPDGTSTVTSLSARIARDLREQYVLGFVPDRRTRGDSFRKIQVRVAAPGHGRMHVRTRPGYTPEDANQPRPQAGKGAS